MSRSKTNRFHSGAKHPHLKVLVTPLDDGRFATTVLDSKNFRLIHQVIGTEPHRRPQPEEPEEPESGS